MANQLKAYDPIFYANEALIQLEKVLGLANTVHRGYDKDPTQKGKTIRIKGPGSFSAQSMPITTDQDINTRQVDVKVDQWEGVRFGLQDDDLSATGREIVDDHIRPAAVAVADAIDQSVAGLFSDVPWFQAASSPSDVTDITAVRRQMFDNKVPSSERFLMVGGTMEEDWLNLSTFHQADTSSDGARTQREGFLGRKFGFDIFSNQNTPAHTAGAAALGTGANFTVNTAASEGDTSFVLGDDGDDAISGDLNKGDTLVIAGNTQRYAVTADVTLSGATSVSITPALVQDYAAGSTVTLRQVDATLNTGFHRNAFALAMAPLSDMGNGAGARIGVAVDPITRLAMRSRIWYDGDNASISVGIDALWGVKTLDPNLGVRLEE